MCEWMQTDTGVACSGGETQAVDDVASEHPMIVSHSPKISLEMYVRKKINLPTTL